MFEIPDNHSHLNGSVMKLVNHNLIAVVGATATGKTRLAVNLAERFNGEVLSADSRQIYMNMVLSPIT